MKARSMRWGTALVVLCVWEVIGRLGVLPSTTLPPPSRILTSLFHLLAQRSTWFDFWVTGWEIGQGLVIGVVAGLVVAVAVGLGATSWRIVEPLLYYLGSLPKIILLPLFLVFLGSGVFSKVGMGAVSAFFPVTITTATAIRQVDAAYLKAARTLGAGRGQLLAKVFLPAAIGPILSGLRIGLGVAVTGVLLAETSVASAGVGFRVIQYYNDLRIPDMYGLLFFVFLIAVAINAVFGRLIRHFTRYTQSTPEGVFVS